MICFRRMAVIQQLVCLGLLCCCCWVKTVASSALNADGQEPWLVVWKKGVDGNLLWDTLCPTISIGDDLKDLSGSIDDLISVSDDTRKLQSSGPPELVLNCSARFDVLFNGFAGHFTLKELNNIKDSYKYSVDHVVSDKPITVDGPLEVWAAAKQQQGNSTGGEQTAQSANAGASPQEARPQMFMDFPANGTQPHRQLLFTPPQHLAGPAKRRMLPEEYNATWGLDILDQGQLPLDTMYHYTYNGTGVHVYILDTGIRTTHEEFIDPVTERTRAMHGYDAVYKTNSSEDCHGHGSHVAAVVGGNTFGVAKNVTLHAVRVLACDGTAMVSALLRGLEWVAKNHIKPAVVHMSIEGGFSSIVNQAVEQLIKVNHVHVVVSSGNSNKDACLASPASSPSAITVAAIDDKLNRWAYANWGACVDVFAPGVAILSAVSNKGDDGTAIKTGTSMAAPFVTGVVAAYLETHPGASPEEVQQKLYQRAMRGMITDDPQGFATMYPSQFPDLTDISSTPNRLVRSNLTDQATLSPGRLMVTEDTSDPLVINITLSQQPSDAVTISVTVPGAWDGTPMAEVYPSELVFTPDNWDQTQGLVLQPRPVCDGDYFVKLSLQGPAGDYPALHTVLVNDLRQRSGDTAAMARVIDKLPFTDSGDSTDFADNYGCQATDASPDVVYSYTATQDSDVTISTCGSGFDTKLLVSTNLNDPGTYMCNDDDRTCVSNTACSRLDVSFKAGTTYYIVVDGYSGASGEYTLAVNCNPSCPPPPGSGTVDSMDMPNMPQTIGGPGPVNPSTNTTSNTRLIQTLLHLSHAPTASPEVASEARSPSPEPPPPPSPSPALPPSPSPGLRRNARAPPIGSAIQPYPEPSGPDASSAAETQEQGAAPAVQGPIGVLLGNNAGAAASQAPAAPAAVPAEGTGRGPLVPVPGPLGVIQASSFEGRNNAQDSSTGVLQVRADTDKKVPVSSSKEEPVLKTQHNEKGVSPVPTNPQREHVDVTNNKNNTKADTASVGDTAGKAPPSAMLPIDGPEGRRPQQVDQPQQAEQLQPDANLLQQPQHGTSTTGSGKQVIELVPDLGGPIGLKHAGDEEDDQQLSVLQTGLGHGAGGFSSSGSVRVVGKQSSRFADLDAMLGTPSGSAGVGVGGSGVGANEHDLGNDAAGPRTAAQVDVQTALGDTLQSRMSSSQGSGVGTLANEHDHGNDATGSRATVHVDVQATSGETLQPGISNTGSSSTSTATVALTASQKAAAETAAGGKHGDTAVVGRSSGRSAAGWELAAGDLAVISSESEQLLPVAMNNGR